MAKNPGNVDSGQQEMNSFCLAGWLWESLCRNQGVRKYLGFGESQVLIWPKIHLPWMAHIEEKEHGILKSANASIRNSTWTLSASQLKYFLITQEPRRVRLREWKGLDKGLQMSFSFLCRFQPYLKPGTPRHREQNQSGQEGKKKVEVFLIPPLCLKRRVVESNSISDS